MEAHAGPDELAALCFCRVPRDVVDRDVVLAALWHLLVEYAKRELPITGRSIRHTHLGKHSGLRSTDFRAALAQLEREHLILRSQNGYCMTPRGFEAVREIVDVDRSIEIAKQDLKAA
jgi:predicted transcriptional regulator